MENLATAPVVEQQKSFDLLASVRMMRYDLAQFGHVLPPTRQRVEDEEVSFLVEGAERPARTTFLLKRENGELVYFVRGQWRPYMEMLETGLNVAEAEAAADPRRKFLVNWAIRDRGKGQGMCALRPGEQMVWNNPYPHALEWLYGQKFLDECNLVTDRKLGFLYRAFCLEDGSIVLESQTVDGSDQDGFNAAMQLAEDCPEADMDMLVEVYDSALTKKYCGVFYAGQEEAAVKNAWDVIREQHRDLVDYLLNGLENIARWQASDEVLEDASKRHVYGVWAAFKKRLDAAGSEIKTHTSDLGHEYCDEELIYLRPLDQEVHQAFNEFVDRGAVLVGCGGSIRILSDEEDVMNASGEEVFSAIFSSNALSEDRYGSLTFKCPKGHTNIRPRDKLIPRCTTCGTSVKC